MRTHLDLFSGIGGFSLAARWAGGIETIGFAEIDEYCSKILQKHWPGVPNYGDVRTIPCDKLAGRVWLVTGGPPCQPFSVAGDRRGKSDERHLWPAMRDVVEKVRPAWCLVENVPGIIGMELDGVLADLEALRYQCQPFVVPACAVDAKHQRKRVWIVAHSERVRRGQSTGDTSAERQPLRAAVGKESAPWFGSGGQDVADAESQRRGETGAVQRGRPEERITCGSETLPNTNVSGLEIGREQSARKECEATQRGGETLGDATRGLRHGGGNTGARRGGESPNSGEDVPDPERLQWEQLGEARRVGRVEESIPRHSGGLWPVEPELGRVANGIPNRVDRLKGLGNSIVPQIAEKFIRWMCESEEQGQVK